MMRKLTLLVFAVGVLGVSSQGSFAASGGRPTVGGCAVFPQTNPWNKDISATPLHPRSASFISSINGNGSRHLHADFGGNGEYGIPYLVVGAKTKPMKIKFDAYGDESDQGPYPIPTSAPIENGSDSHVLVIQKERCRLFELYDARPSASFWTAASGAVFNLRSNKLRPAGWTSADAAGLPIFPGLVRYDEVQSGAINHALRFTVSRTQRAYIAPATHFASDQTNNNLPPMGLRLRLKASYDISQYNGAARVVLTALKRYGMIVADNGSDWFITGAADKRWNDDNLNQLKRVPGTAFEAVWTGPARK